MSELVKKSEVLDIWNNYWITDMTNLDAENQLRNLATVELNSAPQLNENQQIVLEWLKLQAPTAKPMQVIFWMMNNAAWGKLDELRKPIMHLTDKQQAQVLEEFGKWAQEQEEE